MCLNKTYTHKSLYRQTFPIQKDLKQHILLQLIFNFVLECH